MRLHAEQDYWLQTHLFRIFNKVFILPFRRSEWIHHPFSPLCLLRHTQMLLSPCLARIAHPVHSQGSSQHRSPGLPQFPPIYFTAGDAPRGWELSLWPQHEPPPKCQATKLLLVPGINARACMTGNVTLKVTQELSDISRAAGEFSSSFTPGLELSRCC